MKQLLTLAAVLLFAFTATEVHAQALIKKMAQTTIKPTSSYSSKVAAAGAHRGIDVGSMSSKLQQKINSTSFNSNISQQVTPLFVPSLDSINNKSKNATLHQTFGAPRAVIPFDSLRSIREERRQQEGKAE
ncbi:MAG: hypothetical protein E7135_08460 [Rikenellaceae bacterium]|nr:hypothetical protein [Rikenellaceae bacterium]